MKNVRRLLTVVLLVVATVSGALAQTLKGTVVDARNGESILGATVYVNNDKKNGTVTDMDGRFALNVKGLPAVIKVNFTGYRAQEIEVYDVDEPITVELVEGGSLIEQVVVVGYGVQKRQQLTASISSVNEELLKQNVSSVESVLQGAVAGLNVTSNSGQPGATSNIRIRGGNSITGGNEPLYVIDGFIVYNDVSSNKSGASGSDATLDPLAFLNPADIESIEVLKDVSATAIYGTRGANGVIIITTKKGFHGRNNISYSGTFGWSTASKKLDLLNASQFADAYNELNPSAPITAGKNYDWQDAALRTAGSQEHQLSVAGGDERTRYSISGSYKSQEGIVRGTDLKRYAGRINFERNVFDNLLVGINASGAYNNLQGLRNVDKNAGSGQIGKWSANNWMSVLATPTTQPIYNADGTYNYAPNPTSQDIYTQAGRSVAGNAISDLENTQTSTANTRFLANAFAEYEVIKDLKLKASVGADLSGTRESNYAPSYTSTGLQYNGVASVGDVRTNVWQTEFTASYNKTFGKGHNLSLLGGYTAQRTDRSAFASTVRQFASDAFGYNNLSAGSDRSTTTSVGSVNTLQSWLGRVNYSYDSRYNLSATFRADGSSRFASNNKWGVFPSLGASWNLDKERFLHLGKKVDFLQLRLSAGVVGNQEIGDYQFAANVSPTVWNFITNGQKETAYYITNKQNPDLRWERTASYNVGISSGFFKNRLTVTLDAYYKNTSDLLLQVPVEAITGYETALRNVGSVTNKGVELEIGGVLIDRKDLHWNVNANIAHNVNEVTDLGLAEFIVPTAGGATLGYISPSIIKVGEPLGTFYGYKFKGIVQADTDLSKLPTQSFIALEPGNPYYEDVNGDGVVNSEDQTIIGNAQPKINFGLNTSLKYKNFDFFLALAGTAGNKVYNALAVRMTKFTGYYNCLASVADRWTPTNPSQVIQKVSNDITIVSDDRFVENGSYLRFKNIQLGYTFPLKKITKDAKLRLYLSLQNFFTITKYSGYDPESARSGQDEQSSLYQGIDMATYPTAKTVQLGVQITL